MASLASDVTVPIGHTDRGSLLVRHEPAGVIAGALSHRAGLTSASLSDRTLAALPGRSTLVVSMRLLA